jgi:XTP/dITP diphosphohydrolase
MIKELVIATHNKGKAREIAALLDGLVERVVTAGELGLPEPEETGVTFAENAVIKARAAAEASGKPALADDSGLAVDALKGDPGVYSARWGGPEKDFNVAMRKVHDELMAVGLMADSQDRKAAFICALALVEPGGEPQVFEGRVEGQIVWPMRGDQGFGYDPIFQPLGYDVTFAEMEQGEKQKISHRADAFRKLIQAL